MMNGRYMGKGNDEIPVTYVPARNTIFISIGLAWAEILGSKSIFIGVNAIDYSSYPDCRPEYIEKFQELSELATKTSVEGEPITIHTPLINLSKAEIINLGTSLGIDYGFACGKCDSCYLRKNGFAESTINDPTRYR